MFESLLRSLVTPNVVYCHLHPEELKPYHRRPLVIPTKNEQIQSLKEKQNELYGENEKLKQTIKYYNWTAFGVGSFLLYNVVKIVK